MKGGYRRNEAEMVEMWTHGVLILLFCTDQNARIWPGKVIMQFAIRMSKKHHNDSFLGLKAFFF